MWTRRFGMGSCEEARSVGVTADGGFIVAGITDHISESIDAWLIRLNELGDTLWTRGYGGQNEDQAWKVQQTSDGGYVITGWTYSNEAQAADFWLVRINELGDTLWTHTYGGSLWDEARCVQQTNDNGYIIVGNTELLIPTSSGEFPPENILLESFLLDGHYPPNKAESWLNSNYNSKVDMDVVKNMLEGKFGQKLLRAYSHRNSRPLYSSNTESSTYVWLLRTDEYGDTLWSKTYGDNGYQAAYAVRQTTDGGFIITGSTQPRESENIDIWLIRTDSKGDTLWTSMLDRNIIDVAYDCKQTSDGGFIVTGETGAVGGNYPESDVWLIRLAPEIIYIEPESNEIPQKFVLKQNYPNPFNPFTTIKYALPKTIKVTLKVYNLLGQEITTLVDEVQTAGIKSVIWDGRDYSRQPVSSGLYIYRIQAGEFTQSRKMAYVK